jgi:CDP-diacylglycerol--glycerol-3-phosphate 3-phosphatidyltransferase
MIMISSAGPSARYGEAERTLPGQRKTMAIVTPPRQPPVFNIPNQLTAGRFLLSLLLFWLIHAEMWIVCLIVFGVAAFTDWLDGYIARKQGISSTLGRNLDPLVDKILICGAYTFLIPFADQGSHIAPWMVTVVVARELVITGLRSFIENMGASFGADWLGKIKMGLQCGALVAVFFALQWTENPFLDWVRDILIYAMLTVTALSGLQYLWRSFALLKNADIY